MQPVLFNSYQILLIKGSVSIGDNENVESILEELGFSQDKININGVTCLETKNLYSSYLEGKNLDDLIFLLKERIYELCKVNGIGSFDFFIIDATNATMFKSIWHDGFY